MNKENVKTAQSYQGVSRVWCRSLTSRNVQLTAMDGTVYWCATHAKQLAMTGFCAKDTDSRVFDGSSDPFSLIFHDDEESGYFVLFKKGIEAVIFQTATKTLQHKDFTILMIYIIYADWRNGRCRLTTARIAEMIGHKIETIYPSIRRLKKACLLVPVKDSRTGEKLHLLNPFLLKAGSGRVRGAMIKAFNDALKANGHSSLMLDEEAYDQ